MKKASRRKMAKYFFKTYILYRSSVSLGADYTPNADDEVEDLYDLIVAARAKVHFDAVCNGAILSDYQGPDYYSINKI